MKRLVITYAALVILAAASWLFAVPSLSLAIAAAKALAIGWVFMELSERQMVPRTIAVVAVLFISLLIAGTLVDVDLR